MGRHPLPTGSYGSIAVQEITPSRYRARARYRGQDGVTRTVARFGQTKSAATRALREALADMQRDDEELSRHTRVNVLLDRWLADVERSERAVQTKDLYRYLVKHYVRQRIGALQIGEATTGRCDAVLQSIATEHGPSVARSVRAVLNGVFKLAVSHGALTVNPTRETQPISTGRRAVRALTVQEAEELTDRLRSDKRAVYLDLPDLVDFALDTGARIGELLALREADCDLDTGTVTIRGTVVRKRGEPLHIQETTKSAAGERVLAPPAQALELLKRRRAELRFRSPEGVVFSSPIARTLRDPSNCAGDLREVLSRLGCEKCGGAGWVEEDGQRVPCVGGPWAWVTFHTFRKTVATRLDEKGLTSREIADYLGHAQPSMTLNVYMGRRVLSPRAAEALTR